MAGTIVLDKIQLDNGTPSFQFLTAGGAQLLTINPTSNTVTFPDGSVKNSVFTENSLIVSSSYTVGTNRSAMAVGPITLNAGVTLTIPANSRLVIL